MMDQVLLTDTIEYLDLHDTSSGFKDIQVKSSDDISTSRYFDRSLYVKTGESLQSGLDILIFGGFRGDY